MTVESSKPPATRASTLGLLAVLSCLLLPALAFIGGRMVVGPYAGSSGLLGYLGSILSDAARGHWLAWVLLLGPALTVALWIVIGRIGNKDNNT